MYIYIYIYIYIYGIYSRITTRMHSHTLTLSLVNKYMY